MIRIILKESATTELPLIPQNQQRNFNFFYYLDEMQHSLDYNRIASKADRYRAVLNLIREIRPLHDSTAIEVVGQGAMGIAIALSNGNILKIGEELRDSTARTFSKLGKDNFAGQGSTSNLHVYDEGEIKSLKMGSGPNWTWREVPKYKTFKDHYYNDLTPQPKGWRKTNAAHSDDFEEPINRHSDKSDNYYRLLEGMKTRLRKLGQLMTQYHNMYGKFPTLDAVTKYYYNTYKTKTEIFKSLPEETAKKVVKAFYELAIRSETSPEELDVHTDNLGIDQHGNFVFFDF
jgi:hypothetical protein